MNFPREVQTIMMMSQNITNKDALRDKIHEIHNYLRNNGAGYGMNALKVFNIIYGLKKIEENNLLDKIDIKRPECEFSYLLNLANQNKDEELAELIFGKVLPSIFHSVIKDMIFYKIPENIKGKVFTYLVKEIENITIIEKTCNVQLSGKIYEYFIGRDESAISELGAYFTDRHIVQFIYKKLDPSLNKDGSIKNMIDMFGGSGGFTTGYINYLVENYPDKINWITEISKIYHYDMNEDVIKSAALEFFCLTGVLPDMKNIGYKNSFSDEFNNDKKFDLVITNPPYGGDTIKKSQNQEKREKVKEYIKQQISKITDDEKINNMKIQLKEIESEEKKEKIENENKKVCLRSCSHRINRFAKKFNLKGNDKESCSLMLMADLIEENGTCIGVLKEGVFFNSTYKDLRKTLIENYNVREIISVPQNQFENTSTKTSIIIFDNTEIKTSEVIFSELIVEKYEEDKFEEIDGKVHLIESKDDIKDVYDRIVSQASKKELLSNKIYSFNGKDYNKKEIKCGEGYKLVKLTDLCKCLSTTKHYTSIGKPEGKYRFYNSSQDSKLYVDFCEIDEYSIILGQGGQFNIHFDKNFTASKHACVIQSNTKNIITLRFIYYIIPIIQSFLQSNGSVMGWINKTNINNLQIPIPISQDKINYWVNKISKPYDDKIKYDERVKNLEKEIQDRIKYITENEECEEVELGSICNFKDGYDFYRNEMDDRKIYVDGENLPLLKIGSDDITDYVKINSKYENVKVSKGDIIIGTKGSCGKIRKVIVNLAYHKHGLLKISNFKINKNYLYFYLKNILTDELIEKMSNKSVLSNMKKENLEKLKIKIPKNKQIITDLEPLFAKIEKYQNKSSEADKEYKQYIKELADQAIIKETTIEEPEDDTKSITSSLSSNNSVKELKERCKQLKIKGYSTKNKAELINLIEQHT